MKIISTKFSKSASWKTKKRNDEKYKIKQRGAFIIKTNLAYELPLAYNRVSNKGAVVIDNKKMVMLTAEQEKEFTKAFKIGILKELHKKRLLTDEQLKKLIEIQK